MSTAHVHLAEDNESVPKPGPVPQEALDYFKKKKIKPGFRYTDVWKQEHTFAFTVAKVMELDILEHVRASTQKAIEDGETFDTWKKNVAPRLEQSGWRGHVSDAQVPSRLRNIYDTNMRVARAAGQEDRAQRTKKVLPYFVYELGPSKEHRKEHAAWNGLIFAVDDKFWDEHTPPCAYGCKCRKRQISKREAEDKGGVSTAPEEERVTWKLPDGKTTDAPAGVHPSFAYPKNKAGREKVLGDLLTQSKKGQDGPKPDSEGASVGDRWRGVLAALRHRFGFAPAEYIDGFLKFDVASTAALLPDGARRVLAELVEQCPREVDTTGITKLSCDTKTARTHISGALTKYRLVGKRESQERLNIYVTSMGRAVHALLQRK